jgi:hypothetical protein
MRDDRKATEEQQKDAVRIQATLQKLSLDGRYQPTEKALFDDGRQLLAETEAQTVRALAFAAQRSMQKAIRERFGRFFIARQIASYGTVQDQCIQPGRGTVKSV